MIEGLLLGARGGLLAIGMLLVAKFTGLDTIGGACSVIGRPLVPGLPAVVNVAQAALADTPDVFPQFGMTSL